MKFYVLFFTFLLSLNGLAQIDNDLYQRSGDLFSEGKFKKALPLIDQAIEEEPGRGELYVLKGQILYALNEDANEFFSFLTQGVEAEPDSPSPLLERGYYYDQIGDIPNAILDFKDALKLTDVDSTKIFIYTNLGGAYQKIQKPQIGYDELMKGYALDSNDIGVLNNMSMCLDDLKRRDEARACLLRIVEIDSTFFGTWVNLGFMSSLDEDYAQALVYLDKANEIQQDEPFTLNNRGHVKMKLGDLKGAMKDINRSIELDPNNSYAYRNRALVYLLKEDKTRACEDLLLAKQRGFKAFYGPEVDELINENCSN